MKWLVDVQWIQFRRFDALCPSPGKVSPNLSYRGRPSCFKSTLFKLAGVSLQNSVTGFPLATNG